jgi:hypothetical protein
MKKSLLLIAVLAGCFGLLAAQDPIPAADTVAVDTTPKPWTIGGQGAVTYNEVGLFNWAAGGQSNMTLIGQLNIFANRKVGCNTWDNALDMAYGFIKNNFIFDPQAPVTKAEDKVEFNSKYGRMAWDDRVFYTGLMTFRTQFAPGYAKPLDSVYISKAMSPAYLLLALGLDFKPKDYISIFVSPVSGKLTMVLDDSLSSVGAYGVNSRDEFGDLRPGSMEKVRMEFGATVKVKFKKDILKNVGLESNLELFTNYLDRPENIDVRWTNALVAKINKFFVVNLFTDMIYDNDIAIPQVNPRTGEPVYERDANGSLILDANGNPIQHQRPFLQFKEVFGLGFSYKF